MSKRRKMAATLAAVTMTSWLVAVALGIAAVTSGDVSLLRMAVILASAFAAGLTGATVSAVTIGLTVPSALASFQYGRANPYPPRRHLRSVPTITETEAPEAETAQHQ